MRILLVTLFVLLVTVSTRATVVLPADLGELSREARTIVRGTVVAVDARWAGDRRAIETLVTVRADDYLKGPLGATVQFRVPGGRIDRYRSVTVGAPEFAIGQRAVVFLGGDGPRIPHVLGLHQGVFRLARERSTWVVVPPPVAPSIRTRRVVRGDVARRPMPLAEFERRVRALTGASR